LNPNGLNADRPVLKVNVATASLDERSFLRTVSINTPGTVELQPGGNAVLIANSLDIDVNDGAQLDVNDNTVIVDYDLVSPLESVVGYLVNGYSNGSWDGAGLASGIAGLTTNSALGYGEALDLGVATFAGVPVDNTCVVVTYTFYGDSDLDGDVDVGDLGSLASNWQLAGGWTDGDMDYNGVIDVNDLGLFASNWQQGVEPGPTVSFQDAAASLGLPAVPEPANLALLSCTALLLTRSRLRLARRLT
jgi:hypothetical protein